MPADMAMACLLRHVLPLRWEKELAAWEGTWVYCSAETLIPPKWPGVLQCAPSGNNPVPFDSFLLAMPEPDVTRPSHPRRIEVHLFFQRQLADLPWGRVQLNSGKAH